MLWVLLYITAVFGILRFTLPVEGRINKKDIYKDLAHIWIGLLFGMALATTDVVQYVDGSWGLDSNWWIWAMAIGITVLEVVAFVVRKKPGVPDFIAREFGEEK